MYLPQPRKTSCRTISAYATRDNYLILYRVGTCECYLSSWARDLEHHRRSSAAATLETLKTAASTATHTAAEEAKETADTAVKVQSSTASLPSYCPLPPRVFFLLHAPSVQIIVLAPVPVTLILRHPQHQPHAPSPITLPSYSSPTIPCPITVQFSFGPLSPITLMPLSTLNRLLTKQQRRRRQWRLRWMRQLRRLQL